uniref:Hypothetical secreted peptide n=1 Tax=Glossina morsitans morsitans TaxID=37546 RepID=D3TSG0_GLOMM
MTYVICMWMYVASSTFSEKPTFYYTNTIQNYFLNPFKNICPSVCLLETCSCISAYNLRSLQYFDKIW